MEEIAPAIGQAVRSEQGLKAFVEKSAARLVEPGKSGDDRRV